MGIFAAPLLKRPTAPVPARFAFTRLWRTILPLTIQILISVVRLASAWSPLSLKVYYPVFLSLHMGVGCGKLTAVHVGGIFRRWEYILSGPPLTQVHLLDTLIIRKLLMLLNEDWYCGATRKARTDVRLA